MGKESRYYWLKLREDFFTDDAIEWLEEQPNGPTYCIFYLKLCLRALNSNGILIRNVGEMILPYDYQKLADITNMDIDTVVVAMKLMEQAGLVQMMESGEIYLNRVPEMTGSETKNAESMRRLREERKNQLPEKTAPAVLPDRQGERCPVSNAKRQKAYRAKQSCLKQTHVPAVSDSDNRSIYNGNYYLVLRRDQCMCCICSKTQHLQVVFLDSFRTLDADETPNREETDMITLCKDCLQEVRDGKKKEILWPILRKNGCSGKNLKAFRVCDTETEEADFASEDRSETVTDIPAAEGLDSNEKGVTDPVTRNESNVTRYVTRNEKSVTSNENFRYGRTEEEQGRNEKNSNGETSNVTMLAVTQSEENAVNQGFQRQRGRNETDVTDSNGNNVTRNVSENLEGVTDVTMLPRERDRDRYIYNNQHHLNNNIYIGSTTNDDDDKKLPVTRNRYLSAVHSIALEKPELVESVYAAYGQLWNDAEQNRKILFYGHSFDSETSRKLLARLTVCDLVAAVNAMSEMETIVNAVSYAKAVLANKAYQLSIPQKSGDTAASQRTAQFPQRDWGDMQDLERSLLGLAHPEGSEPE